MTEEYIPQLGTTLVPLKTAFFDSVMGGAIAGAVFKAGCTLTALVADTFPQHPILALGVSGGLTIICTAFAYRAGTLGNAALCGGGRLMVEIQNPSPRNE